MAVYQVQGAATQDESDNIYWTAWCELDGEPQTDPTNCTVTLYLAEGDGTRSAVSGATESVSAPASDGVFNGKITVSLTAGRQYYFVATMTVDAATRTGIIPVCVPVRA